MSTKRKPKQTTTYNGWKNYETWNVALWIGNDEGLYQMAKELRHYGYKRFAEDMKEIGIHSQIAFQTPDGVAWNDSGLDIAALDEMMEEL